MIENCKDTIKFKRAILIESGLIVYSTLYRPNSLFQNLGERSSRVWERKERAVDSRSRLLSRSSAYFRTESLK